MPKHEEKVGTAKDVIEGLSKLPPDAPVYFDCPHCGKSGGFHRVSIAVMVTTIPAKSEYQS